MRRGGPEHVRAVFFRRGGSPKSRAGRSGEDRADQLAGDVGEAEAAAVVEVGQALVVEPEEVEDRGVEVGDGDGAVDGLQADLVGRAVADAGLDAGAGEPGEEAEGV